MKILLWPFSLVLVVVLVVILVLAANTSRVLSWIASWCAATAVNITLWHGSVILLQLLTSTQSNTNNTQGNTNEFSRQDSQKQHD
jgi:preprotein translocase subunit SecG